MLAIWSFGVSPYGLSLCEEDLWALTPREYAALRGEWERSKKESSHALAVIQATLYNAHFRGEKDAVWLPEDFMGTGNRAERQRQKQREQHEVALLNMKLARMKPNQKEGLPEWAIN